MVYFGEHFKCGEKRYMSLKGIDLQFKSEAYSTYHNDVEYSHKLIGQITVEALEYVTEDRYFYPFGRKHFMPEKTEFKIPIGTLPPELQEELKQVWLKVEKALEESCAWDSSTKSANS